MSQQLPLGIGLRPGASFANFHPGPNRQALEAARRAVAGDGEPFLYLWGEPGTGRSHLLQAACGAAAEAGREAAYVPLARHRELAPEILAPRPRIALVCLDDLQTVAGAPAWEEALFGLFNRLRDAGATLMVTADRPPAALPVTLPDLKSRLGWGLTIQLHPLDDEQREAWLVAAAAARGMELPAEAARYILHRAPRDMGSLARLLETLDRASLVAQRRLTTRFVASVLFPD